MRGQLAVLTLDHLTVIAPTLEEGVAHLDACLGLKIPFGTRHAYMGTHNHGLRLGEGVYLEIIALDPDGLPPGRARWFGLDSEERVRSDWDNGRRLRGWVAATGEIGAITAAHPAIFGDEVPLPPDAQDFAISIPEDGSLPLDGAVPSLIDHRGRPTDLTQIPDLGARLSALTLAHPDPGAIEAIYRDLEIDRPPTIVHGPETRYRAMIGTPSGMKELT
ncbi:MAG: VOC family protein [Pseudomonadota bacterium]